MNYAPEDHLRCSCNSNQKTNILHVAVWQPADRMMIAKVAIVRLPVENGYVVVVVVVAILRLPGPKLQRNNKDEKMPGV